MKKLFLCIFVVTGFIALAVPIQAASFTVGFYDEFSGDGAKPPEGPTPWLVATFDDGGSPGSVALTMAATNLTDKEWVSDWYFNFFDPGLSVIDLVFTYISGSGPEPGGIKLSNNGSKADGGGLYDIQFSWNNGDLTGDDIPVEYSITGDSIVADSFNELSSQSGGNGTWVSAAHIQSIGDDNEGSGFIGGLITTEGPAPIPEPATLLLLGVGLVGLAGFGRKKLIK